MFNRKKCIFSPRRTALNNSVMTASGINFFIPIDDERNFVMCCVLHFPKGTENIYNALHNNNSSEFHLKIY